jgi:hypothetical protein
MEISFCCFLFQLLTRKNKKYGAFHKKYPEDFCNFPSKLRIFLIIVVSYLLLGVSFACRVCLSSVGCLVLTVDCRVSLLVAYIGSWLSDVGSCMVSGVGSCLSVVVVRCGQLNVGVDYRSLFPLLMPSSAKNSKNVHVYIYPQIY